MSLLSDAKPLYCEECQSRVILTVQDEGGKEYRLECGCESVRLEDGRSEKWSVSADREEL